MVQSGTYKQAKDLFFMPLIPFQLKVRDIRSYKRVVLVVDVHSGFPTVYDWLGVSVCMSASGSWICVIGALGTLD